MSSNPNKRHRPYEGAVVQPVRGRLDGHAVLRMRGKELRLELGRECIAYVEHPRSLRALAHAILRELGDE